MTTPLNRQVSGLDGRALGRCRGRELTQVERKAELQSSAIWYEEKYRGLGFEFVAVVDRAFQSVLENPEACPVWRPDRPYRKRLLKRFPYGVFFRIDQAMIEIAAVAHTKRRPA